MKSLISINHKFMSISPKRLVELIKESKHTKGVEIYIDFEKQEEVDYLNDLVPELKQNDLILQVHANVELDMDMQIEYFKLLERYSDELGYQINVTFHTIYNPEVFQSLSKTLEYMIKLIQNIDTTKFILCLENLNNTEGKKRPNKEEIRNIVADNDFLYLTYDIGHELADNGRVTELDAKLAEEIKNVHVHTNDGKGEDHDHMPIYQGDMLWDEIMKGINLLKNYNYDNNVVYEYALEFCKGESVEERIKNYLRSIDFVSENY